MRLAYFSVPIFLVLTVILGRAELGNSANTVELMGVVANVSTCGGAGNSIQLRISGCEGYCQLLPGQEYECEEDFMPSMQNKLIINTLGNLIFVVRPALISVLKVVPLDIKIIPIKKKSDNTDFD